MNAIVTGIQKGSKSPYTETINLVTKDGEEVKLDKGLVEYTFDEKTGRIEMEWHDLAIKNGIEYIRKVPAELFDKGAWIKSIDIEEGSPTGYEFKCESIVVKGKTIPLTKPKDAAKPKEAVEKQDNE